MTHIRMLKRDLKEQVTWTWDFAREGEGTRITVDFHETEIPWLEHLFEGLGEKSWDATVNGWLAHIKTEVEKESSAAQ